MYTNILIPTDGTEFAERAIEHALKLAKLMGAKITAVTVMPPLKWMSVEGVVIPEMPEDYKKWTDEQAGKILATVVEQAKAVGVACDTFKIEGDAPYEGIIQTATQKGCDLIVMASHGRRGVSALLLGSETQKVLTHSKIPVLVYR